MSSSDGDVNFQNSQPQTTMQQPQNLLKDATTTSGKRFVDYDFSNDSCKSFSRIAIIILIIIFCIVLLVGIFSKSMPTIYVVSSSNANPKPFAEESYPDNDVETPKSRKKRNIETMSESDLSRKCLSKWIVHDSESTDVSTNNDDSDAVAASAADDDGDDDGYGVDINKCDVVATENEDVDGGDDDNDNNNDRPISGCDARLSKPYDYRDHIYGDVVDNMKPPTFDTSQLGLTNKTNDTVSTATITNNINPIESKSIISRMSTIKSRLTNKRPKHQHFYSMLPPSANAEMSNLSEITTPHKKILQLKNKNCDLPNKTKFHALLSKVLNVKRKKKNNLNRDRIIVSEPMDCRVIDDGSKITANLNGPHSEIARLVRNDENFINAKNKSPEGGIDTHENLYQNTMQRKLFMDNMASAPPLDEDDDTIEKSSSQVINDMSFATQPLPPTPVISPEYDIPENIESATECPENIYEEIPGDGYSDSTFDSDSN